jgi:hypothetical protein
MVKPKGGSFFCLFDFLPTSVAIFATSLLDAIPMELGKCNLFLMPVCRSSARPAWAWWMSEMSRKASSMEICSTKGVNARNFPITFSEYSPYNLCRPGTMMRFLQSCSARDMGMALRTPIARAAYEHEATTPRSFGLPPTAKGLPRNSGFWISSTEQ